MKDTEVLGMDFDIMKASERLSELELKITSGNLYINVLWFRVMRCNSENIIERHTHSAYEFHFVYKGSSDVSLDTDTFTVHDSEFYVTTPGVYHRQHNSNGYIEFSLSCELGLTEELPDRPDINGNRTDEADHYTNDYYSEAFHIIHVFNNYNCMPVKDSAGVLEIFYKALSEAYHQCSGFYNNICAYTIMLVSGAARCIHGTVPASYSVTKKHKKNEYRFTQIKDFIKDNISLPLTASDISRYMFLSEKQITRIVKEACGMTAKELVQDMKFKKAKSMLIKHRDLTARQISEMLGFSSEYYFNQFFKRMEGYPPGVYRLNVR